MVGNSTVDASQCKPETLLYSSDECNKQPCGEGKKKFSHISLIPITNSHIKVLNFTCFL